MNQNLNQSAVIEEISPEEAACVYGGNKVRYRVEVRQIKGTLRKVHRIFSKKSVLKLKRVKKGIYLVKYRAIIKNKKNTVSHGNSGFRPASNFF